MNRTNNTEGGRNTILQLEEGLGQTLGCSSGLTHRQRERWEVRRGLRSSRTYSVGGPSELSYYCRHLNSPSYHNVSYCCQTWVKL